MNHDVIARIREAVERASGRDGRLRAVVGTLSRANPHFSWTGIYLLEGETLVLHNQVGLPTPHERIPIGQGICGLAAREGQTVIVPDVGKDPRYLACSLATRSEIVVPVFRGGSVVGEIDVDSDLPDAFGEEDRRVLEEAAGIVGEVLAGEAGGTMAGRRSGDEARQLPFQDPIEAQGAARGGRVDRAE